MSSRTPYKPFLSNFVSWWYILSFEDRKSKIGANGEVLEGNEKIRGTCPETRGYSLNEYPFFVAKRQ